MTSTRTYALGRDSRLFNLGHLTPRELSCRGQQVQNNKSPSQRVKGDYRCSAVEPLPVQG
jgi:hypothetical protein